MSQEVLVIGKRGVRIPVVTILAALPLAVKRAKEMGADDRDPDSPGGEKVTAQEALEDIGAFFQTLAEQAAPAILEANGIG